MKEAVTKGELNGLPGQGKPLELENLNPFMTHEERIYNRLLKNLGLLPLEVNLLKEIEYIGQQLAECTEEAERDYFEKKLIELTMHYNIKMEARKRGNKLI